MLKSSALSALAIMALSLAVWVYLSDLRALDVSETTVVVGFFTALVLGARWLLARLRRRRERTLPVIAWWTIAPAMATAGAVGLLVGAAAAAGERDRDAALAPLACASEQPTTRPGEVVMLKAWRLPALETVPRYTWTATSGSLAAAGDTARWTLDAVPAGVHRAMVRVTAASEPPAECTVAVVVRGADDTWRAGPEAGFAVLAAGQRETPGYGLYSYLLLGAAPDDATRDRYLRVLDSYLRKMPHVLRLEQYLAPDQLNVTYVPVTILPTSAPGARWLLDHYDIARARSLLRRLPGNLRSGPYFVSSSRPLGDPGPDPHQFLLQDLSTVPLHLVDSWVIAFLNQSSQEHFWKGAALTQLALKMRTIIAVLGLGLPDVRNALKDWIGVRN
jgi:hypothetical protein